jgi:hypothetical protein
MIMREQCEICKMAEVFASRIYSRRPLNCVVRNGKPQSAVYWTLGRRLNILKPLEAVKTNPTRDQPHGNMNQLEAAVHVSSQA